MRGIVVVLSSVLYTILCQREIVSGHSTISGSGTNEFSETNQGDEIEGIQTRSSCIQIDKKCKFVQSKGVREACCPKEGQQGVACRAINTITAACGVDPCVAGKFNPLKAPGFKLMQPRCDAVLAGETGDFDYQCVNNKTCSKCLPYDAKCGMAADGGEMCCDYLTCNQMQNKCEFKSGCFPAGFSCTDNKQCCKGFMCKNSKKMGFCKKMK